MSIHCSSIVVFWCCFFWPQGIPVLSCGYWKVCLMTTQVHMSASAHVRTRPNCCTPSVSLWQDAMRFCQHTQERRIGDVNSCIVWFTWCRQVAEAIWLLQYDMPGDLVKGADVMEHIIEACDAWSRVPFTHLPLF